MRPVIIICDQVVDIAYHLDVIPKAMVVRESVWPLAKCLKLKILGCPKHIVKKKESIFNACQKFKTKRIYSASKNITLLIYRKKISPLGIGCAVQPTPGTV